MGAIKKKGVTVIWRTTHISLIEENIIYVEPTENVYHEVEDVLSFRDFIVQLTGGEPSYIISDLRYYEFKVSREAMNIATKDSLIIKHTLGQAYLVDSLPNRLILRFYLNVKKPPFPVSIFKRPEEAFKWVNLLNPRKRV